ncbi:zinc transport system substrate-binding protein [Paenibacillus rhizosphaerae]|uniref:Zinc transport system substrate-binding protein n=1 Tax=Paenibacillus rhizosphaerae TaxID=297318 RepID=A0A839TH16_9BACL|nr:metal ABC transporter substrate-binding protein [Paenibacillus rhizosphaerae]MBB3126105.1 zinc transport system substrate-binding protein [Paenibacillus rhizosphaerae]
MNKRTPFLSALIVSSMILVLAGCGSAAKNDSAEPASATAPAKEKLKIETSFYPMYEFTRQVAGDLADVHLLVPAGTEPHDWEPTPKDMAAIEQADMLVYNGAGLESWVDQVVSGSDSKGMTAVEASKGLELIPGTEEEEDHDHDHDAAEGDAHADEAEAGQGEEHAHEHEHDHGAFDPHVWLSPKLAIGEVRTIEAALSAKAPEHKAQFEKNAAAYIAKLQQLDEQYTKELSDTKRKDFITQHAAFGYLAHTYGLTQVPIAGLSPEQEPSAQAMAEVVKFAQAHQVKTIFFETLVSSSVADTIAKEVGAKSAVLNPIEGLTAEDEANHLDYLQIMQSNLTALVKALNE